VRIYDRLCLRCRGHEGDQRVTDGQTSMIAQEATQAEVVVGLCRQFYGAWAVDTGGVSGRSRTLAGSRV
jgi:hypothetical protein